MTTGNAVISDLNDVAAAYRGRRVNSRLGSEMLPVTLLPEQILSRHVYFLGLVLLLESPDITPSAESITW
jgi:hypothetical protein